MKLTPAEGLSSSHVVFTGEVTNIAQNEETRFGGLEVTLRVNKVWKGAPGEEVKVHTAGSSAACGFPFVQGKTYLVYAVHDEADPMRVSLCSRTALLEDAGEDIEFPRAPIQRARRAHESKEQRLGGQEQRPLQRLDPKRIRRELRAHHASPDEHSACHSSHCVRS